MDVPLPRNRRVKAVIVSFEYLRYAGCWIRVLPVPRHPHLKDEGADVQNAGHAAGGATGESPVCAAYPSQLSFSLLYPHLPFLAPPTHPAAA